MDKNLLKNSIFFKGLTEGEADSALKALKTSERSFSKGERILKAGDITEYLGLITKGSATIESNDLWGNRTVLGHVEQGGFFAETYAFLEDEPLLVDVVANEDCRVVFLKASELRYISGSIDTWQVKLLSNLLRISTGKNLQLSEKSFQTSPKTIRGKVMAYLNSLSLRKGTSRFLIPFDRQQMADYLNVERTALSKELSKMQRDGLIRFRGHDFEVLYKDID